MPVLTGPYLGQAPPGRTPEVFAPGLISFGFHEHGLTFSRDGTEAYFVTTDVGYSHYVIVRLVMEKDRWSAPTVAPFSGRYRDGVVRFAPDGRKLFFSSHRPLQEGTDSRADSDIWMSERAADGWTEPLNLGTPVNTEGVEAQPSVSSNGTLYYQADYDQETAYDLYTARLENGRFETPEKLGRGINTEHNESAPFISPDGSYLIFQSNRPGGLGSLDLYVSFKLSDGSWGVPVNLGATVNSPAAEFAASVSPDGKYLFFSSYRTPGADEYKDKSYGELQELYRAPGNGYGTQYWVRSEIIEELRKVAMGSGPPLSGSGPAPGG
jgi:Tol biopolymer transport system component